MADDDARRDATRGGIDRRWLLAAGALIGGTAAVSADARPPGETQTISGVMPWKAGAADNPAESAPQVYRFFGPDEVAFLESAVDRLIPPDSNGPGGKEAGVGIFLDRQLGGPYGHGDHFYLQGPWPKGLPTQGYQQRMTPAQLYKAAIPAIDGFAKRKHGGKAFHELGPVEQDSILKAVENGEAKLDGVDAKAFFAMFLQNTIEGYFADPIYGGNRNMGGWKMIGFPGAHYDYSEWVERHGEAWPYPPVGLKGRPEWSEG